jgi:hypothetical protein
VSRGRYTGVYRVVKPEGVPVVAIGTWEVLVPGTGRVPTSTMAYRASLGARRLTVWGVFSQPERSHCRVARYSGKPPMVDTYFIHAGQGERLRIRLTHYPTITQESNQC